MEKHLKLLGNPRAVAVAAITSLSLLLMAGIGDSLAIASLALIAFIGGVGLGAYWHRGGKLPELDEWEDE